MRRLVLLCALAALFPTQPSRAGVRHFTFLYEAPTSAPGTLELENYVTFKHFSNPGAADAVEFRHELEYGVTDHFQASFYLADYEYENSPDKKGWTYTDNALELIYNLTNPVLAPLGLSLYQEYKVGYQLFEWESKCIAQKNFGPWIFACNVTLEATWEGKDLAGTEAEFSQALGASYEISPRLSVGLEMLHEMVFPEWHDHETIRNFFIGPNVSYRRGNWFGTVTALAQATDTADEAEVQVRAIFGIGF